MSKFGTLAALKASSATWGPGQNLGPAPHVAPSLTGASPLVQQYSEWSSGRAWNYLPRPMQDFLTGAFGPLSPIAPVGIDEPDEETGRAMPRRWQYPVGWNMPIGVPGTEGIKLVPFSVLRQFCELSSLVRACIQVRKHEILGLKWDIGPTLQAERNLRSSPSAEKDFQTRKEEITQFWMRPDDYYQDFQTWLGVILEDLFAVDAATLYLWPSREPGKGVMGSDLAQLATIDGTTIRPLLDLKGGTPRPPAPGYQQYLWGIPRSDLMDVITDADIASMQEEYGEEYANPVRLFRTDQLLYLPYTRRTWTPYGFPPPEQAIIPVTTSLKRQQWQLDLYTEGSIPGLFVIPGPDVTTPAQIRELQETLNAIAGDIGYKHKVVVLPAQSKTELQKPIPLADQMDGVIATQVLMAFDVMPTELGIMPGHGGGGSQLGGLGSGHMMQESQQIMERKATKPLLMWLKRTVFDYITQQVLRQKDMEWKWVDLEGSEDEEQKADTYKTLIASGVMSVDEVRVEMGRQPWGLPNTADPVYLTAAGITPFGQIDVTEAEAALGDEPIASQVERATALQQQQQQQAAAAGAAPGAGNGGNGGNGNGKHGKNGKHGNGKGNGGKNGGKHGNGAAAGKPGAQGVPGAPPPFAAGPPKIRLRPSTPIKGKNGETLASRARATAHKAAMDELEALRRYLRKGKPIADWRPVHLDPELLDKIADEINEKTAEADLHKAGNPEALRDWYNDGADGQIDWGSDGDFDQCVVVASQYMDDDQARGFCQERHMDATGQTTSEHAADRDGH